jgi:integrase
MRRALTDVFIRTLNEPESGRVEIADLRMAGLCFRVTATGARSWCFRFRDPRSGKTTRATIGPYPALSLQQARERAAVLRAQVASGQNPVERKRHERETATSKTFEALAERYLSEHARRHKRSADADARNLRLHVLPKWGKRRFDEIRRADVIELVENLVTVGKPTLANRVQALASSIFSFAMDADLVAGNPCARLRRRGVETIGRRVLSTDEIRQFWPAITQPPVSPRVGLALRLILLTGARPGEVAGICRTELENIDEKNRARWVLPAARSKNGRAHLIPLSDQARRLIASLLDQIDENDDYLFPSPTAKQRLTATAQPRKRRPIAGHALAVAMARFVASLDSKAGRTWQIDRPTPHDLRRTVATRLAELGIAKEDRDAVLNHTPRDVGKIHYDLYDREREKRRALDRWAHALWTIVDGRTLAADIVPLRRTEPSVPAATAALVKHLGAAKLSEIIQDEINRDVEGRHERRAKHR